MATLVLGAVGAAIGGAIAPGIVAFGLTGAAIGWQAGALLGSLFTKGPNAQGPRLNDLRVTGTDYGQPIPWVAGSPRIAGQIAWASAKREIANTQKVGKGGGQKVTTFTYEVDLLILLTENPVDGIGRIWSNGDLVYNGSTKEGTWSGLAIYTGDPAQLPDPIYEAAVGVGNAPAYRGHAYVVIQGLQLGQSGQIPNLTFEISNASLVRLFNAPLTSDFNDVISPITPLTLTDDGATRTFDDNGVLLNRTVVTQGLILSYIEPNFFSKIDNQSYPGQVVTYAFDLVSFGIQLDNPGVGSSTGFSFQLTSPGAGNNFSIVFSPNLSTGTTLDITSFAFGQNIGTTLSPTTPIGTWKIEMDMANSRTRYYLNNELLRTEPGVSFTGISRISFNFPKALGAQRYFVNTLKIKGIRMWLGAFNDEQNVAVFATPLEEVIDGLMIRAGYDEDEFDTSQLVTENKLVRGMAISQVTSTRAVLEQLQSAYFFESSKSDKIYFFPRASSSVASIPYEDMGAGPSPDNKENSFELVNANELELPAQVALTYANISADYNSSTEFSQRLEASQDSTQTIQLPLGLLPSEAKGIADALLFDQLASLTKANIRVPLEYAYLDPGDIVTTTNFDGRQYRMRIGQKTDELTSIGFELVLDDVGALDSASITDNTYTVVDTIKQLVPTLWEAMDIPLLTDRDNEAGFYVAVSPDPTAAEFDWPGAVFARSFSGENYVNEFLTSGRCVLGTCDTTLGNWSGGNVFDESNSVTVTVTGELSSTTRTDMLADLAVNMCLIGNELVRFRLAEFIATSNGRNQYKLTGLLRGQRGTEQYQTGHVASERFVLLDGNLRSVIDQNGQIGADTTIKAVTLNLLLSSATEEAFSSDSVRLKPFSVVQLRALADGSDLDVTWNRRTRLSYRYGGTVGASVPLGETSEAYRIKIFSGATLKRTVDVTTNSYTYTAANIAADGFTTGQTATIVVSQLSEIVGEGFTSTVSGIIP